MGGAASHHENELVLDVLSLHEPAFAVNGSHQIVAWNDGAERLLGLRAEQVIGMRCYEALSTSAGSLCTDCDFRCSPSGAPRHTAQAVDDRASVAVARAFVTILDSEQRRVHVTTLAAHTRAGQLRLVHLLHDAPDEPAARADAAPARSIFAPHDPLAAQSVPIAPLTESAESSGKQRRPTMLTQRELEVLRLLGAGHSTDDIARELSITRVTARNHVNKVLDKLGVNSRLQAVVIASQLQLI
jgi:DNA-binding CsgD family transcriptional regulator